MDGSDRVQRCGRVGCRDDVEEWSSSRPRLSAADSALSPSVHVKNDGNA